MKRDRIVLELAGAALALAVSAATVFACSSNSAANSAPPDDAASPEDGGGGSGSSGGGSSSGSSGASSSGASDAATDADAGAAPATCVQDGGDAAVCNSCATAATDPYNTCSQYFTVGCIPFDDSVVPSHPSL